MATRSWMVLWSLIALCCALLTPPSPTLRADDGGAPGDAPTPTARAEEGVEPTDLLNPDGTLRLEAGVSGALDLAGWQVTLDPQRGPVLAPQGAGLSAPQSGGGGWLNLGSVPGVLDNRVYALAVSGGDVYVGGAFTDAGGDPNADYIARWDGSAWRALGGGVNGRVSALAVSGGDVYVGGLFTDAGGDPNADHIARWDGSAWRALGGGLNDWVSALAVSGPYLYVGGGFTNAGGNLLADYVAARPLQSVYLPLVAR